MGIKRINYKGQELLPAKCDLVFKALFAADGNRELLSSLLSCILNLDIRAQNIIVTNTEFPPAHESGRLSRVDVRVKLTDGKNLNVEIQVEDEHNMAKRSVFYTSKLYIDQAVSGMRFDELCHAIAINILDFAFLPYKRYHNRYRLKNTENNDELTDIFEINFIELRKVPKDSASNLKELWMRFLSADDAEEFEMLEKQDPIMEKAVSKLLYASADEKLRYEIDMREKAEMDYWSAMGTNFDKGRQEGMHEQSLAIAKNLLVAEYPIGEIVKATGLTREEVENLSGLD